jgi:hypothetical protein
MQYGFIFMLDEDVLPNSHCFLCAGCMQPSKVKEHLQTVHLLKLYLKSSQPDWK